MTDRGDPRAVYDVRYGCNPDTDAVQTELAFKERSGVQGGHICVRLASGNRHEFRYSPPGNVCKCRVQFEACLTGMLTCAVVDNPNRVCIKVTLAVVRV